MLKQALIVASFLVASSAVAHADPSAPSTLQASAYQPTSYVEVGGAFGVDSGFLPYGAGSVAIGRRIADDMPFWVHGSVLLGGGAVNDFGAGFGAILCSADDDDNCTSSSQPSATYLFEARAGLEMRGCNRSGAACVMGGVDIGWVHEGMSFGAAVDSAIAIPRFGFDVGGEHLRFRPGLEFSRGGNYGNAALTGAIAYQW